LSALPVLGVEKHGGCKLGGGCEARGAADLKRGEMQNERQLP